MKMSLLFSVKKNLYHLLNNKPKIMNPKNSIKLILLALFFICISCKQSDTSLKETKTVTDVSTINTNQVKTIKDTLQKDICILKSNYLLPYNQKLDLKSIKYNNLDCNISGINEYLCGKKNIRYISLPNFNNIDVILVPMDCGDFIYRFYLLTIFNKKLISKQYVEGDWYEPGGDSYKENTSFKIDEKYKITITTNSIENGTLSLKEELKFQILDNGILKKIN